MGLPRQASRRVRRTRDRGPAVAGTWTGGTPGAPITALAERCETDPANASLRGDFLSPPAPADGAGRPLAPGHRRLGVHSAADLRRHRAALGRKTDARHEPGRQPLPDARPAAVGRSDRA